MTTNNKAVTILKDNSDAVLVAYGTEVHIHPDGTVGAPHLAPPANDTAVADAQVALVLGQKMPDGSVFAGLTPDSKQLIYAMPEDLVTRTFNDAAERIKSLNAGNAYGQNDWQIGSLDVMRVLQKNQNEGSLKGTFKIASSGDDSGCPEWYWSSTPNPAYPILEYAVGFSNGFESWDGKDDLRLNCRPVRLVAVKVPSAG
jgi:hypothetical protein